MIEDVVDTQLFVGGEAREATGGGRLTVTNPARPTEVVGSCANAAVADIDAAVQAAHTAFPAWAAKSHGARAALLEQVADVLAADENDIRFRSRLFTRENGKIARETMVEISRLGDRFRQVAAYGRQMAQDQEITGGPFETIVIRQPRGVAALIVPWNWPLALLGAKLPQALVAGNTVVVKVAETAALAPTLTLHKIAEMLPPGVVNVITGDGVRTGDALTGHPLVRKVNFTGSVRVGRQVMASAAQNITPVTLELGGNDAAIVLEDATLNDETFAKLYWSAFATSGQICHALKRLYVHRSRYAEVVEGLTAATERAVVGDGLLPETTMGPLNNAGQLKIVTDMIDEARAAGADVKECGSVPDAALYAGGGYFQKPTLVYDPDPSLSVVREEQFGPVLPILPFDTEAEAIAAANDSDFGLCSSVWTEDRDRALAVARQIEAGYTYINGHGPMAQDGRGPFGGFKLSGIGRNMGYDGVLSFAGTHAISAPAGFLLENE
ncbi:MAG: aldehyde dehydrogenase family protein [Pseudomonadota bacterium]